MIRYDDWDEDVSARLLYEALEHCNQVRDVIRAVLPEKVRPSADRLVDERGSVGQ